MDDGRVRELVDALTAIGRKYANTGQLRSRIGGMLVPNLHKLTNQTQALTDENANLKETILVIAYLLNGEKSEVARLRDEVKSAVNEYNYLAGNYHHNKDFKNAEMYRTKARKARQLLNTKGPTDCGSTNLNEPSESIE